MKMVKAFSDKWTVRDDFSYPTLTDNPLDVSLIGSDLDKIKVKPFIKAEKDESGNLVISGMLNETADASVVTLLSVYNKNGSLIAVKNASDLVYDAFSLSIGNMKDAYSVKVFTWKFINLMPLKNKLSCIVTTK